LAALISLIVHTTDLNMNNGHLWWLMWGRSN